MTLVVHDRVVRLTMPDFEALVADELAEPVRREALDVPGMDEALDAVREPMLVLQIDLVVTRGGRMHLGWAGADALALLLPVDGEVWQLMALPVDQLAVSLARIVGLAPGSSPGRSTLELPTNPFDEFFSADETVRSTALRAHEVDVAWTLGVRSASEEWLMAAASGPAGPWLYLPSAEEAVPGVQPMTAVPVSATDVFRRFSAIVPGLLGEE